MKKILFLLITTAFFLPGCSKDEIKKENDNGEEQIHVAAILSQGEVTKVDIEPNDNSADVFWTSDDAIHAFGTNQRGTKAKLGTLRTAITEKSKLAKFEGAVTKSSDDNYYVLYNGINYAYGTGEAISLDLTTQTGGIISNEYSYLFPYTYMVGKEAGHLDDEDNMTFRMEHLCALLQFNLTLKDAKEGVTLGNIEVSGSNLYNKKNLNVYTKELSDISSAGNKLTLSYMTGPVLSTTTTIVAMASFPAMNSDMNVRIYLYDNGSEKYIDVPTSNATFEAGKRYTKTLELDLSKAVLTAKKPDIIDYEAKTLQIMSREELVWVALVTNLGDKTYSDGYNYNGFSNWTLTQGVDLDLMCDAENQWTPIGKSSSLGFKGSYNGNGYKVENIYINLTSDYPGLFGFAYGSTSNPAVIKNVILDSGEITGNGGCAGIVSYGLWTYIIGCVNKANIICNSSDVGGIIYRSSNVYCIACENYGEIKHNGSGNTGGIMGTSENIIACINHGTIDSKGYHGGIAGMLSSDKTYIKGCLNEGEIKAGDNSSYVGGLVGNMSYYDIEKTEDLYFVGNADLFVAGSDNKGQGWNTKGPSLISDLNSDETIASLNAIIEEWNTNNPDYASPYKFASGGDDNTIPKLVPIE